MRTRYPASALLIVLAIALLAGCDSSTDPEAEIAPGDSVSVYIDAATGGRVNLTGLAAGAVLTIPPGAMPASGEISAVATAGPAAGTIYLRFEPEGLEFLQPVQLTMPIATATKDSDIENLVALFKFVLSPAELVNSGSELNALTLMSEVAAWSSETISGELQHLRQVVVMSWQASYLVVDIPGKYLRPGDGLFVMSGDNTGYQFRWLPGHVGMVSYANPDSAVTTVVESTIGGTVGDGVQTNPLLRFKRTGGHLYLGARRPPGSILNDDARESTLLEARSHLGAPYAYLGGDFGGYNCTGLLEGGWDSIGRGVMGTKYRFMFPTEMYNATVPVSEIEVRVGEEVRIPVYPVVVAASSINPALPSHFLAGNHTTATVNAVVLPDGATWAVDNNIPYHPHVLTWTPTETDSDSTVTVTFVMQGVAATALGPDLPYTRVQSLTFTVLGKSGEIDVYPVARGLTGNTINLHFQLPPGARPAPPSPDHLIDKNTRLYPESVVFINQEFDGFTEGWLGGDPASGYYGASLHISRSDPWGPTPTGHYVWIYRIGYSPERYWGLR